MSRKIVLNKGKLELTESQIEGFLERTINSIGTSAKADVPVRYIGRRAYVIIVKD
jgi:putative transposon-encoded protein